LLTDSAARQCFIHEYADNGAKHIVLSVSFLKEILKNLSLAAVFKSELADEGLTFMDAHALFGTDYDLCNPNKSLSGILYNLRKTELNIAAETGVKTMTFHVGNDNRFPEYSLNELISQACRSLENLLPEAEACGVIVCLENIWHRSNTPEVLNEILSRFPSEYLGFCYDTGHANLFSKGKFYEKSAAKDAWEKSGSVPLWDDRVLEKMLSNVVNCHLHDNDGAYDSHKGIGDGNIDWPHVIGLLNQAPRLQVVQSEI